MFGFRRHHEAVGCAGEKALIAFAVGKARQRKEVPAILLELGAFQLAEFDEFEIHHRRAAGCKAAAGDLMAERIRAAVEITRIVQFLELSQAPHIAGIGIDRVGGRTQLIIRLPCRIRHQLAEQITDIMCRRPRILIAEGDRRDARFFQLLAGGEEFGKALGLGDAVIGEDLLVIEHVFGTVLSE